jgi:hypothetical protein
MATGHTDSPKAGAYSRKADTPCGCWTASHGVNALEQDAHAIGEWMDILDGNGAEGLISCYLGLDIITYSISEAVVGFLLWAVRWVESPVVRFPQART